MMQPFDLLTPRPLAMSMHAIHPIDMLDALAHDTTFAQHRPLARLHTTEDKHAITLTAPGVTAKDVNIEVSKGRLHIAGTNKRKRIDYSLALPSDVDLDGAEAVVEDGLIAVSLK